MTGTINYGRSVAGEVTSITNATYTNLPYNPPNLVSSVVNGPHGPISYTMGNGLTAYRTYDSLTRFVGAFVCNGPAAPSCSGGTQIYGTAEQWLGSQMHYLSDTLLNQQITYGYGDGFNRLTSLTLTSGTVQNYTYAYDLYGNRVSQTPLQGGYSFYPTINAANNHITTSGYTYDPAGNLLNDTVNTYSYDAEGNLRQVVSAGGTIKYVFDAFNHRVHVQTPSATMEYVYDYAGRRVSSWLSPNNSGTEGRIYWDGQQVAYRSSDGTTYFDHQDTLGTERIRTNYAGAVGSSYKSLPWGDGYTATINNSGADQDSSHFAGLERDAESGTEHAEWRNYASAQGRWLAPDPYLGSYDLTNPQTMNRYTYALNNPTSFLDRLGLDYGYDCGDNCVGVVGTPDPPPPPPTQPGNGGCASRGTQGCIPWPCGSPQNPCSSGGTPSNPPTANPPSAPSKQNLFSCASEFGGTYSAAGLLHAIGVPNGGAGGFIADALGGNALSGATDLIQSLGSGEAGGHSVFYNMGQSVVAGPTQGFGALLGTAVKGTAGEYALPDLAVSFGHGIMTAEYGGLLTDVLGEGLEYASGFGEVKLGIDAAVYGIGLAKCAAGH